MISLLEVTDESLQSLRDPAILRSAGNPPKRRPQDDGGVVVCRPQDDGGVVLSWPQDDGCLLSEVGLTDG